MEGNNSTEPGLVVPKTEKIDLKRYARGNQRNVKRLLLLSLAFVQDLQRILLHCVIFLSIPAILS